MQIAKVIGTVVSTIKDEKLEGTKLLLAAMASVEGKVGSGGTSGTVCAVDSVGAGTGDLVLITTGSSARLTEITNGKPVDAVIVAIIDIIEVEGKISYNKGGE